MGNSLLKTINSPICLESLKEAKLTKCGHSFCNECIALALELSQKCPVCKTSIDSASDVFPNLLCKEYLSFPTNDAVSNSYMAYEVDQLLDQERLQERLSKAVRSQLEGSGHALDTPLSMAFENIVAELMGSSSITGIFCRLIFVNIDLPILIDIL